MNVVYFGSPQFATVTLQRLLESRHRVIAVVTQPDKPAGRGQKLTPPPVKDVALAAGVPVLQPASVKTPEFLEQFRALGADIAVVVAYGKILPGALLGVPRFGFVNLHGSLLPKYRGAAPIQWAVANGERMTGATIMQIEEGLDSGPVIAMREMDILDDDDARSVHDLMSLEGAELMVEALDQIEAVGEVRSTPQNHAEATYAPLIKREDARLEWADPAERIICRVRGFVMWPGAFSTCKGEELKILSMEAVDPKWMTLPWEGKDVRPGTVVEHLRGRGPVIKTGDGKLVVATRVKPAGKREMDGSDFANGGGAPVGTLLG